MDTTTKTVLIVGVSAVAAFLLLRAFAPKPVGRAPGAQIGGVSVNGILDFGTAAIGGLRDIFASGDSTPPDEIDGVSTGDFQAGHFGIDYA